MVVTVFSFLVDCGIVTKYRISTKVENMSSTDFSVGEYGSGEAFKLRDSAQT